MSAGPIIPIGPPAHRGSGGSSIHIFPSSRANSNSSMQDALLREYGRDSPAGGMITDGGRGGSQCAPKTKWIAGRGAQDRDFSSGLVGSLCLMRHDCHTLVQDAQAGHGGDGRRGGGCAGEERTGGHAAMAKHGEAPKSREQCQGAALLQVTAALPGGWMPSMGAWAPRDNNRWGFGHCPGPSHHKDGVRAQRQMTNGVHVVACDDTTTMEQVFERATEMQDQWQNKADIMWESLCHVGASAQAVVCKGRCSGGTSPHRKGACSLSHQDCTCTQMGHRCEAGRIGGCLAAAKCSERQRRSQ